ncbi:hypothetical protein SCA6_007653 [Theobroma cacao]
MTMPQDPRPQWFQPNLFDAARPTLPLKTHVDDQDIESQRSYVCSGRDLLASRLMGHVSTTNSSDMDIEYLTFVNFLDHSNAPICGLWVLMHSVSVRIEDGESQFAFTAICDFIHNFFICEECRQHFYEMCSRVTSPFSKARDFALWLWSAHNEVNERLMKEEASLETGDPKFPKIIWPPKQLCPSCYHSRGSKDQGSNQIEWDQDEVFKFLISYYGNTLVSLYKEKGFLAEDGTKATLDDLVASTNAVVVPLGAALAIALASCAFGALACYWRSQQKNRKPRRSWN